MSDASNSLADAVRYVQTLFVEMAWLKCYSLTLRQSQPLPAVADGTKPSFEQARDALRNLAGLGAGPSPTPEHAAFNIGIEGERTTERYDVRLVFDDAAPDPAIILTLVYNHTDPGGTADYE